MKTFTDELTFVAVTCGECGVAFAFEKHYYDARKADHKGWFCPNGHSRVYSGESEAEHLRAEKLRLESQLEFTRNERDRAQRETKRLKKRVHAGVCPDCHRTFQNVARHMQTKHGDSTP